MDVVHLDARLRRLNSNLPATRLIALAMLCAGGARAQTVFDSVRTVNGYCHVWRAPPGLSNPSDLSYRLCAVDGHPKRLNGPDMPAPALGKRAGGTIFIAVRPDGTVDSALTRAYSATGDTSFDNHVLEAVRQWRFEPARRNGVAVRAGLELEIKSDVRDDTVPAHLVWQYVEGRERDTAIARWVADTTRPPPLTRTETDSVYAAVFRQLVRLQVLLPDLWPRSCIVASTGDTLSARHLEIVARKALRRGPSMTTSPGCDRDPEFLRLVMPSVYRTERDRVILFPRGDFLPVWPWGLDAKSWRAWSGRCVGQLFVDGRAAMACGVNPIMSMSERGLDRPTVPPPPSGGPWNEGDSVRFTVLATRSGVFLVDTLHFTVGPLPILDRRAAVDSLMPTDGDHPRSTLATAPTAVIRVSGLRHETQLGVFDEIRILMDHGPPDVDVFVAYRGGTPWPRSGLMVRSTGERRWDFEINFDGGRRDAEYWMYVFRRGAKLPWWNSTSMRNFVATPASPNLHTPPAPG
jgi:TonB family protein